MNEAKNRAKRRFTNGWKDLRLFFSRYWRAYGGWYAFWSSPYLHLAVAISAACWPIWFKEGWWEWVTSVIPSILGFTIGGFAIILAFGTGDFAAVLSAAGKPEDDDNAIMRTGLGKLSAVFCHFIVIQFLAILIAVLAKAFYEVHAPSFASWLGEPVTQRSFWGVAWFFGIYALTLAVGTAHWIFTYVFIMVRFQKKKHLWKKKRQAGSTSWTASR